ncbi:MAG: zinc-dependent alcohol dehydrogenase family protein [Acidobacteria bacterium]|nr:zinc-dependent alcohol dehydrogenase family protein [Acidobacteriota bacterium]
MLAMVLATPRPAEERPLELRQVPQPVPGPGEVLLRVSACGVCRTDLHTVEGDLTLPLLPLVPGHQVVGTVVDAPADADRALLGRRVGVAWMAGACGVCSFCREGNENLCPDARFTGLHAWGGYAEQVTARADFTYPLPDAFPDDQAAPLLCAGVIGYRALRLAGALTGGRLGIFGFGASAHVAIQVATHLGAEVYVYTRARRHRAHAEELGARWVGAPGDTAPALLDRAVIFSPAGEHVPAALAALRPGGTAVCASVTMSDIPRFPYGLLYGERRVSSVANATRRDALELLALAERIPLRTSVESLPLADANEALLLVKRSEVTGALVLRP